MDKFNVFDAEFRADPYPTYARYRTADPVHAGVPPTPGHHSTNWWYLFRYDDSAAVLKDPRFGRDIVPALDEPPQPVPAGEREPFWDMYGQWTLALEPPAHTRQRNQLNHAFTARVVDELRPFIATEAEALLDGLAQRETFDVVADYAFPLTLRVITQLLGVPQNDLEQIKQWSLTIAEVLDYKRTWEIMAEGNRTTAEFTAYLGTVAADRRTAPRDDLISRLLAETGDERLLETEIISLCAMLLFAGHETTVNLISSGAYLLLSDPDQLARLKANPALIDSAVDEFLRLHSPIQATSRIAYADVTLRGKTIRRGEWVTVLLGSANRDPNAFAEPDLLDISRSPNRHLAFGRGIHYCLGAPLAVAQGGIALLALLERCPQLRLSGDPARWSQTFGFRGLESLPVIN